MRCWTGCRRPTGISCSRPASPTGSAHALATALTGRADSQLILEALVTANAFVVSVGGPDTWFRYHPLLRDLLQHRLSLEQPGSADDLHLRAARWFTEQGEPIPALRHATLARDWDEVGRLLTSTALPLILTPAGPALAAALEPAAIRATQDPTLSTLLAAGVCHYHRHDFAAMLRDANAAAEFLAGADDDLRIPAEILIAIMAVVFDRTKGTGALVGSSARLLTLLDRAPRRLDPGRPALPDHRPEQPRRRAAVGGRPGRRPYQSHRGPDACPGAGHGPGRDVRPGPPVGPAGDPRTTAVRARRRRAPHNRSSTAAAGRPNPRPSACMWRSA